MLDKLQVFREAAATHGLNIDKISALPPQENSNDRELIRDFMGYAKETQRLLTLFDRSNKNMRDLANKQIMGKPSE